MTGYLSGNRNKTGSPGYRSAATGTGYGFLARDITALEVNDRGWGNLPPWGYSRNGADPFKVTTELSGLGCAKCGGECKCKGAGVSGLGCGGGCAIGLSGLAKRRYGLSGMEDAATIAANMYIHAIQAALSDTVALPSYTEADAQLAQVKDQNVSDAISQYAQGARQAIRNIVDYGNDEGAEADYRASVETNVVGLQKIAAGAAPAVTTGADTWDGEKYVNDATAQAANGLEVDPATADYIQNVLRPRIAALTAQIDAIGPPFDLAGLNLSAYNDRFNPVFDAWRSNYEEGKTRISRDIPAFAVFIQLMTELNRHLTNVRKGDSYAWQAMHALLTGHPILFAQLVVKQIEQIPHVAADLGNSLINATDKLINEKCSSWWILTNLPGSFYTCLSWKGKAAVVGVTGLVGFLALKKMRVI